MAGTSDSVKITKQLLLKDDLLEACRLSRQTKWNQTESDWLRLIELNPDTCYKFQVASRTIGTATITAYDRNLAWIGMIIVDRDFRGLGAGQFILKTVIEEAKQNGFKITGLDATEQGRRLYQHYGFRDVCPIDRWSGNMKITGIPENVFPLDEQSLNEAIQLDRKWSGYDRSGLIKHLFNEKTVHSLGVFRKNRLMGFAFIRPGLNFHHIGPLLAEEESDFTDLLDTVSVTMRGEAVLVDAIRRQETSAILKRYDLEVQRKLMRMTLDEVKPVMTEPELRVASSFEWG